MLKYRSVNYEGDYDNKIRIKFLKFLKTDNLQGSFIDFYKEIQNEEHLELNLTARNLNYLKDCEDIWDELYKEKYGEHSSYFIKNKITYADALKIRFEKNKPLLQNYIKKF